MTLFCQSHWRDTHIAKVVTVFTQWGLDPIKNWKVRKGKQEKQSGKHRRASIYPAEMIQKNVKSVKGLYAISVFLLQKFWFKPDILIFILIKFRKGSNVKYKTFSGIWHKLLPD